MILCYDNFFILSIADLGFSDLKIELPATKISAPDSTISFAFSIVTPPSTSIKKLFSILHFFQSLIFYNSELHSYQVQNY